jgi:hypothetical protein
VRFFTLLAVVSAFILWPAATASGSTLFARDAKNLKLAVNASGQKALLTYKVQGAKRMVTKHVLVWGAVNALQPTQNLPQVQFKVDYTGGPKKAWKKFKNKCQPYDGPELTFVVAACKARDGSYWAVQAWQYWYPFFGYQPWLLHQDDVAFHISHWTGPLALIELWSDWIDLANGATAPHFVFGRMTYGAIPVYGYVIKPGGIPGDGYGRIVYFETFDSKLGSEWWRLTGILTRNPSGMFCHAMIPGPTYSNYPNPHIVDAGNGTKYRVYGEGPGVTPLVSAEVDDPGDFDMNDPAKVTREEMGDSLLQQWSAPPACLKGN